MLVVFGCGGDRDAAKRPLMGAVAARLADLVVLTSDNPRSEDPQAIIDEIRAGIPGGRAPPSPSSPTGAAAIERAVAEAGPGDVVVIAGKGHETTQTIGETVLPFDDREVARDCPGDAGTWRRPEAPVISLLLAGGIAWRCRCWAPAS